MIDTALRCMASAQGKLESKDFRCLAFRVSGLALVEAMSI